MPFLLGSIVFCKTEYHWSMEIKLVENGSAFKTISILLKGTLYIQASVLFGPW